MNQIIFSKVRKQPVKKAPEALLEKMGVEVTVKRNGAFVIDQDTIKLVEFNDETGEVRITLKEAPLAYMDTPQPEEEAPVGQPKESNNQFTATLLPEQVYYFTTKIQPQQVFSPSEVSNTSVSNGQIKSDLETHCPTSDYPSFVRNTEIEKAFVKRLITGPQGLAGLASYSVASDLEKTAESYEVLIKTLYEGPGPTGTSFNEALKRAFLLYNHYVLNYPQLFGNFETIPDHNKLRDIFKLTKLLEEVLKLIKIYKHQL